MSNVFQRSLEEIVDRRLSEDPQLLHDIWQLRLRLNRRHFAGDWVDALMQSHRTSYDMYDAYGFAFLWSAILRGDLLYAICEIGKHCAPNANVVRNNELISSLNRIMGSGGAVVRCQAQFSGGLADSDGEFAWLDPMNFSRHRDGNSQDGSRRCQYDVVNVGPNKLPLEVGTTSVGTTCGHILAEGGLARWPYWSPRLFLFYARPGLTQNLLETIRMKRTSSDGSKNG